MHTISMLIILISMQKCTRNLSIESRKLRFPRRFPTRFPTQLEDFQIFRKIFTARVGKDQYVLIDTNFVLR